MTFHKNILSSGSEKEARDRASKALRNARQRCTNKKDPDYPNYGGSGIEVRFKGVAELIAAIGLPKPDQSLDRIDPNGHYELHNVRWASAEIQAANKKLSASNYHLSDQAAIQKAKDANSLQLDRKFAAVAWRTMLLAHGRRYLLEDEVAIMALRFSLAGVFEANFDLNTIEDSANDAPGCMHLPALSLPGARARLRAEANDHANAAYLERHGRLACLEKLDPHWNMPMPVWQRACDITNHGLGLALFGKATPEALLGGWTEGACLALASSLPRATGCTTAFFPMLRAINALDQLGSPSGWEDGGHPLLDDDVVLIPDFVLDCGAWGELPATPWKVWQLLTHRAERGLKTIVGAPSANRIPKPLQNLVLGKFETMKMPARPMLDVTPMKFSSNAWTIPENGVSLKMMKDYPATRYLVSDSY